MKLNITDMNGKQLEIKDMTALTKKVDVLLSLHNDNPTKGLKNKFWSLIGSETFLSMFTEGEISSRKKIIKTFADRDGSNNKTIEVDMAMIKGFQSAYSYVLQKPDFSIASLFNIYSSLSTNAIKESNKLKDTEMFRSEPVYIGSEKLGTDREGAKPENIKKMLDELWVFLKNDSIDIYIRAIIGHIYFEYIHPYYDFNGRTGRFIPMWLFKNNNRMEEIMYFATAIGNYKDSYLKLFKNQIDDHGNMNIDRFTSKILDLLILNQQQYIWYKSIEKIYLDKTKKNFTMLQKDLIWTLMIKCEKQNDANGWNKLDKDDFDFIEKDMNKSQFSRESNLLKEHNIIDISDTRPPKYKLLNYRLFGLNKD